MAMMLDLPIIVSNRASIVDKALSVCGMPRRGGFLNPGSENNTDVRSRRDHSGVMYRTKFCDPTKTRIFAVTSKEKPPRSEEVERSHCPDVSISSIEDAPALDPDGHVVKKESISRAGLQIRFDLRAEELSSSKSNTKSDTHDSPKKDIQIEEIIVDDKYKEFLRFIEAFKARNHFNKNHGLRNVQSSGTQVAMQKIVGAALASKRPEGMDAAARHKSIVGGRDKFGNIKADGGSRKEKCVVFIPKDLGSFQKSKKVARSNRQLQRALENIGMFQKMTMKEIWAKAHWARRHRSLHLQEFYEKALLQRIRRYCSSVEEAIKEFRKCCYFTPNADYYRWLATVTRAGLYDDEL